MNDSKSFDLSSSACRVAQMVSSLGWERFHRPHYLVAALAVEASELLDKTLWKSDDDIDAMFADGCVEVADELADVAINFISLVRSSEIDIHAAIDAKVAEVEARYTSLGYGNSRATQTCAKCRKPVRSTWSWCPVCGTQLKSRDALPSGG